MNRYEVVVGNICVVYSGVQPWKAREFYDDYVEMSIGNYGRAAGENVALYKDGSLAKEYIGRLLED